MDPIELMKSRQVPAQLCVIKDGEVLVDATHNTDPDSLFWVFSASKPFTAILVHELITDGLLDIDAPVADYWTQFAQNGKGHITLRMVLQHRTGMATAGHAFGDALAMADWDKTIKRIERAKPRHTGPSEPAYQFLIFGHILGEVIQRVTGEDIRTVMRQRVIHPLGLNDTHLGLSEELWDKHVDLGISRLPFSVVERTVNTRKVREAIIPAAGISTTARDLAQFYAALLDDGRGVIDPRSIARMREPSSDVVTDRFTRWPMRWSHGFQLGLFGSDKPDPMGKLGSAETFGHNGSDNSLGWADPERGVAFAYTTGRLAPGWSSTQHLSDVSDAARLLADHQTTVAHTAR